jgi:hypothetical protein
MGRKSREKARRKGEAGPLNTSPKRQIDLLAIWGVPGVGKTTFANWLVRKKHFTRIDSDYPDMSHALGRAWVLVVNDRMAPADFVKIALQHKRVVLELGLWADDRGFHIVEPLVAAGAEAWWFDGDRGEAFRAWSRTAASRKMDLGAWERVVSVIRQNEGRIETFFGPRRVRTIEPGPVHVTQEVTYATIFTIAGVGNVGPSRVS